ncbi:hypothetical protein RV15_GL001199 [Enterococcus silesiacus]|uniref:PRD domain-containing protein n=1 Tax=Enterococcus silesiacus TaxID=332949 RepID=A0AA91JQT7_9ENTE|nr:hypothetical protein RV15_GL001199 [Enterococcus silesiacus]
MEIPQDILEISAEIVKTAQFELHKTLNPNMVFSLADHLHFAITRMKNFKDLKLIFSYDIQQLYPRETQLGRYTVQLVQKRLLITLPESEITTIAMHFVNAQEEIAIDEDEPNVEELIGLSSEIIENQFQLTLNREEFHYNRFVMHLRYYIKRIQKEEQFVDSNDTLFRTMKDTLPSIYACATSIATLIYQALGIESTEDELLYLMIHINRIVKNTQ